jgi:hypothetical protein
VAIPSLDFPTHYKLDPVSGEVVTGRGSLFFNDSVPFVGSIIDYTRDFLGSLGVSVRFTCAPYACAHIASLATLKRLVHVHACDLTARSPVRTACARTLRNVASDKVRLELPR